MSQAAKQLERMRANPAGDWTIAEVLAVCRTYNITCSAPRRGDHFKISHPTQEQILTVPAHRPINAVYIRKLVKFVADVLEGGK